jgi:hypothetical protein
MNCAIVPVSEISRTWPYVRKWIKAACIYTGGAERANELKARCMNEEGHVLVAFTEGRQFVGAAILSSDGKSLHVTSIGGDMPKGWKYTVFEFLRWVALHCRVREITLKGRKGWRRELACLGFVPAESGELVRKL